MKNNIHQLDKLFNSFRNGLNAPKSTLPREFLETIGLDQTKLEIGFNSGQFHHRRSEEFRKPFVENGMLTPSNAPVNAPDRIAYTVFGTYSIVFPLMDSKGNTVNFYAYKFALDTPKADYLNDEGIYPHFPDKRTTRLYLCQDVISTASLIQSGIMENRDAVIALKNGEYTQAIFDALILLKELDEVILIGENSKVKEDLKKQSFIPEAIEIKMPEDHTFNDMWVKYGINGIEKLIVEQMENTLSSPNHKELKLEAVSNMEYQLEGEQLVYNVLGAIPTNSTILEFNITIEFNKESLIQKFDLLDFSKVKEMLFNWTEGKDINYAQSLIEMEFIRDEFKRLQRAVPKQVKPKGFSTKLAKQAQELLNSENLFEQMNELIEMAGIVGENNSRLPLFLIASSYKFRYNLHAVVQSNSITQGSEFITKISRLIPETDQYAIELTSSRTFRHYYNSVINNKLIVIPDYTDITASNAIKDLKRLQAKGKLTTDAPQKTPDGQLNTLQLEVEGHFASIGACTRSKKYFDAEPRTVLIGLDESDTQMEKLIEYDCLQMAGMINAKKEGQAREILQYIIQNVFPLEVVNPYAKSLILPASIPNARIYSAQLMQFTALVTLFNQHQRRKDNDGKVITQKVDVQKAIDMFLDSILISMDELDSTTRKFFERLKVLMKNNAKTSAMSSLEIRQALVISKTSVNRFLKTLVDFEYVKKEGHKNTGFTYTVENWKPTNAIKEMILSKLGDLTDPK